MSRSGYIDDCPNLNLYRASVRRSLQSKHGQPFLRELATTLDAMPARELIRDELIDTDGNCCAIGAVCKARGIDCKGVDVTDPDNVGALVDISRVMAAEIEYINDEDGPHLETDSERWTRVRKWVSNQLK